MAAILVPLGILVGMGLLVLASVSAHFFSLQLLWMFFGVLFLAFFLFFDWRTLLNYRWVLFGLYGFVILLLLLTHFTAPVIRNTRSWLVLGPFQFQPVELAKIALILVYANYFSRRHLAIARIKYIVVSFVLFLLPATLIMMQPDLGSTSILFGIWAGFLLVSGLPRRWIVLAGILFLIFGAVGWKFVLHDYQRERILGVIYPEKNVLGINYSVAQSKIAIGSAGFFGKGFGQGPQTQLGFLTEPEGDFVFAALVEEWGILGGLVVIGAFFALIWNTLRVAIRADQNFEKFICIGAAVMFLFQFIVNVGTAIGLVPVVGVTLPFVSYGGSSLLTNFLLMGIIVSIARRTQP